MPPIAGGRHWAKLADDTNVLFYIPTTYDGSEPARVLMLIHDMYSSPVGILEASGFESLANEHNLVLIAPEESSRSSAWTDRDFPKLGRVADGGQETRLHRSVDCFWSRGSGAVAR